MIKLFLFPPLIFLSCTSEIDLKQKSVTNVISDQVTMNLTAEVKYKNIVQELDSTIERIQTLYEGDSILIKNLKRSQEEWIDYRNAQLMFKYPEEDPVRKGSVFNTCYYSYLTKLTSIRAEELNEWLKGIEEGEVCGGSVLIVEH